MIRHSAIISAALLTGMPALAFDASKFPSPTYNAPQVDRLIMQSLGTTGQIGASTPTAAALRAMPTYGFGAGAVVQVAGYAAAGDGGGGAYTWSPTSTAADDGCLAVRPAAVPAGSAGRWLRAQGGALNVRCFGAKMDGSDDRLAYSAARSAAKNGQVVIVPSGIFNPSSITGGPANVVWNIEGGTTYADGTTPVTNIQNDLSRSVLYGTSDFWSRHDAAPELPPLVRVDRSYDYVGGQPENVVPASQTNCNINGTGANTAFENYVWCNQTVMRVFDKGPGQHVAMNGTVFRLGAPAGVNSGDLTSPTWAGLFLNQDDTGKYLGNQVGIEVDVVGTGVDTGKRRVVIQGAIASHPGPGALDEDFSVATGMTLGSNTPVGHFGVGYELTAAYDIAAFDASRAPPINNAPGFRLASGQRFAWTADSGIYTAANNGVLETFAGSTRVAAVDPSGNSTQPGEMVAARVRETQAYTPASSTTPCFTGQRSWDANFEYRCVATNTWKRAALSSW